MWAAEHQAHLDAMANLEEVLDRTSRVENELTALIGRVLILERKAGIEANDKLLRPAAN